MATTWRTRIQAGLAIALFFGSLGTLLYNVYSATALPQRELQVRHILQQATHLMATQADPVLQTVFLQNGAKSEEFHRALVPITSQVLQKFSGLEAGSVVSVWGYTAGFVVLSALAASAFSLFASTMPETSRAEAIDGSTTRQLARRQVEFTYCGRHLKKEHFTMIVLMVVGLLVLSNLFMTMAWYGHLKFLDRPLWLMVIMSWGVAFFEYCLQVPANRLGYTALSAYQLKTVQEVITLVVFILFAHAYIGEGLKPKHLAGFVLLGLAAWTVFQDRFGLEW